ncbi:MAG: diacylglycerol kinase, partial [Gammaproteobacteria bacterium]
MFPALMFDGKHWDNRPGGRPRRGGLVAEGPMNERLKPQGLRRLFNSFGNSWLGLRGAWREEAAFRQECLLAIAVIPAGLWFGRTGVE